MTSADAQRALLRDVIRRYVHEVRGLSIADVRRRQVAPWSNIGHGAAGIAYALWRLARHRRRRSLLPEARRWWHGATAGARRPGAFSSTGELRVPAEMTAHSLVDGPAGLPFLGALIAHDLGDRAGLAREMRRFARACEASPARPPELLHGTAGLLVGALALDRVTRSPRARAIADRLARELLVDPRTFAPAAGGSLAHGAVGVVSALLQWAAATGGAVPGSLFDALAPLDPARCLALPPVLRLSWCNGLAGQTLVWIHAHRCSGEPAHLARAIATARIMTSVAATRGAIGNLCCGLGGSAYALRALSRVAPARELERRARDHAVRATARMGGSWPNGLMRGWPGVVCLAADLLDDDAENDAPGFPLVEA